MGKKVKKNLRALLASISILLVLLLLLGLGYFWMPGKYSWLPDKYLWMIDYYFRMPERYLGQLRNERLEQVTRELYETKSDMEAFREALGEPDDTGTWDGQEVWTYKGYREAIVLSFDIHTRKIVDIGVLRY